MRKKNSLNKIILVFVLIVFGGIFPLNAQQKTAISLYNEGLEFYQNEDYYDASQNFLEVVNINSSYADAWFMLSDCSYHLSEYDLALSYLENAEKYEKNNSKIQNLKGMIFLALGRTKDAKSVFNEVLKKYPNDIDSHFGLAEIELYDGKFSGAESQYLEALKRQNTNRRALLSLSLVCAEIGRYSQADEYLRQALQYYSGEPEVHYLASVVALKKQDYSVAEKQARIAVELNGNYIKAYELLASILYFQSRYDDVIDLCDFLISRNRNNSSAWYLKGIAQSKLGNETDAIQTWSTGLNINPRDEIMRFQMELSIRENLSLEDSNRTQWANFHINNAKQYESRFDKSGSSFEYQRALILDPMNTQARLAYANNLQLNGMNEAYLRQLQFIQEHSTQTLPVSITDSIEAYNSLLENTLAKKWNVEPFYLDKIRWNIAIFYVEDSSSFKHARSDRLTALACSDIFSGVAITSVKTQVTPISGYADAFRNARSNNYDYFVIVSQNEGDDDLNLKASMYSGRTGSKVFDDSFYATGNNRFSTVLRRFRNSVLDKLTVRGKILDRNGKTVLIDLGKSENITKDAKFKIIKKGNLKTADSGIGLFYKDDDVVGTLTVTVGGEEVSEAEITSHGFFDRINVGDEIILEEIPQVQDSVIDNVPNADENGNEVVNNNIGENLVNEIKKAVERPAILDLLRSIY